MSDQYETTVRCVETLNPSSPTDVRYTEGFRHPDIPGITVVCTTNSLTRNTIAEVYYERRTERDTPNETSCTLNVFNILPVSASPFEAGGTGLDLPIAELKVQDGMLRHTILNRMYQIFSESGENAISDESRSAWNSLLTDQDNIPGKYLGHRSSPSDSTQQHRMGYIKQVFDNGRVNSTMRSATQNEAGDWMWEDDPEVLERKGTKSLEEIKELF